MFNQEKDECEQNFVRSRTAGTLSHGIFVRRMKKFTIIDLYYYILRTARICEEESM